MVELPTIARDRIVNLIVIAHHYIDGAIVQTSLEVLQITGAGIADGKNIAIANNFNGMTARDKQCKW